MTDNEFKLINAVKYGNLKLVKELIEQGTDIHIHNGYALRLAAKKGRLEIVKYLVEMGAYIHAVDDFALRFAKANGHTEVVEYLEELDKVENKDKSTNYFRIENDLNSDIAITTVATTEDIKKDLEISRLQESLKEAEITIEELELVIHLISKRIV